MNEINVLRDECCVGSGVRDRSCDRGLRAELSGPDGPSDYTPVTQVKSASNVLLVHPSLPVRTVKDLIALAKSRPGQIDYASSGNGSPQHLTGALFCKMAGIRARSR